MNDDIKRPRSPSAPRITLQEAIELATKLHQKAGKSSLPSVVAAQALGYSGLNGAALGLLSTLKQYGLLSSDRTGTVSISPLAIRLIHPLNTTQEMAARKEAALSPKEFSELFSSGYHACSEDVLTNHLIQNQFTSEGARRAASVFKQNEEFAKLNDPSITQGVSHEYPASQIVAQRTQSLPPIEDINIPLRGVDTRQRLRDYRFLLDGENEVEVRFYGEVLGRDQVQGLIDYLEVMMKRLAREGEIRPREGDPVE